VRAHVNPTRAYDARLIRASHARKYVLKHRDYGRKEALGEGQAMKKRK
jgi:hypothetical protein